MRAFAADGGLSSLGGTLLIGLTLVLLFLTVLGATATVVVWRVYRRVRRWRGWHRRASAIDSRTLVPGPARDLARLRRDLRTEVEAADVMLSRAKDGRLFVADARALVDDLKVNAAALDADLASIQSYSDAAQQRRALIALRPQVAKLIDTSYLARQTMLHTAIADRERRLTDLNEHVERQAAALKIYRQGAHGLDLSDSEGHLDTSSDPKSSSPASEPAYPPGAPTASWRPARLR